jgi:hypothetical protein
MQREVSLDAWRGLMLVVMAVNHLGGPMGAWVRQVFGYVSAAEGFVFLSGIMCGLVYTRYSRVSLRLMFERLWRRAGTVYGYHIAVLFILLVFVNLLAIAEPRLAAYYVNSDLALFLDDPVAGMAGSVLCLHLPRFIGILGLYVVYLAAAPFILMMFIQGRAAQVFAISGGLWLFAQTGGSAALAGLLPAYLELGTFDAFGWQVLFVAGGYFGWRRSNGLDVLPQFDRRVLLAAVVFAAAVFVLRHWGPPLSGRDLWGATDLLRLGWLRVLDAAAMIVMVYGVARLYGVELTSSWLALLGRNALQVFCLHSLVIYMGLAVLWRRHEFGAFGDAATIVLFVVSLGLAAHFYERGRTASRLVGRPARA